MSCVPKAQGNVPMFQGWWCRGKGAQRGTLRCEDTPLRFFPPTPLSSAPLGVPCSLCTPVLAIPVPLCPVSTPVPCPLHHCAPHPVPCPPIQPCTLHPPLLSPTSAPQHRGKAPMPLHCSPLEPQVIETAARLATIRALGWNCRWASLEWTPGRGAR